MFNELDNHLYSYKISTSLSTKEWSQMQEFPEYRKLLFYTTVVSSKHIYFIQNENVHQLEYSNPAAKWKKISSMKEDHGLNPPAVMLNGFIYVCGNVAREASRSVERYDVALDRWTHMCDMNIGRNDPCVVATEDHIYCIGGLKKQSVERFDERLDKWEYVKSAPTEISFTNAAVVKNRIYVIHDVGFLEDSWKIPGVLCYDVQNDLWSKIKLTIQCPFVRYCVVKILAVDDELYIFGNIDELFKYEIYLLKPETGQMILVEKFEDRHINPSTCLTGLAEKL